MSNNIIAKFNTPSNSQGRNLRLIVNEQQQGKNGLPVVMYETVNSRNLPAQRTQLYLEQTRDGSKKWFSLSSPLRKVDENGFFALQAKTNESGAFLNHRGEIVQTEKEAAKQFEYIRDEQGKVLWGTIATLSVKNTDKNNQPLKGTMLSAKFFSDSESLQVLNEMRRIKGLPEDQRKPFYDQLATSKQSMGQWTNMFIKEGHELLRGFGFQAREMQQPAPSNEYKDDIPF